MKRRGVNAPEGGGTPYLTIGGNRGFMREFHGKWREKRVQEVGEYLMVRGIPPYGVWGSFNQDRMMTDARDTR